MRNIRSKACLTLLLSGLAMSVNAQLLVHPHTDVSKGAAPAIAPKVPGFTPAHRHDFSRGDQATFWVSPLLTNHDGKISGRTYRVEGKVKVTRFGFSVVNPTLEPLDVDITCPDKNGTPMAKYGAKLRLLPHGAATWSTDGIAPERSRDAVTVDTDLVWCGLTANRPFLAFGTRWDSDKGTSDVSLTAVAR
ncbi:MAG: hypothetical protein AABZ19_11230 [Pseudomonadota bacterium]